MHRLAGSTLAWRPVGYRVGRLQHQESPARSNGIGDALNCAASPRSVPALRPYRGLGELAYPYHDRTITVTRCGRICFGTQEINLRRVSAGQNAGIKEVRDKIWLVTFMHYDLGFFDHETCRLEPAANPFEPKLLPMSPV